MAVGSWQLTDVSGQLAVGFWVTSSDVTPIFFKFQEDCPGQAVRCCGSWYLVVGSLVTSHGRWQVAAG